MGYYVKVIPPSGRARVHDGTCKFCRHGQGMENQDKGTGPTYWQPAYPSPGFGSVGEALQFMSDLGSRYEDTGRCAYCMDWSRNGWPAHVKSLTVTPIVPCYPLGDWGER
jgi:hypothetical protein